MKYKDLAPSSFIDQENSTILANRNNSQDIMTSHVPQYRDIFLTEEGSNNNFNLKVIIYWLTRNRPKSNTEFNEQFNNIPHESILGKTQNITNPVVDRKSVTWGVSGYFKMNKALPCGVECTLGAVKILPIL